MSQSRIEAFTQMLEQMPEDAMVWYGLASEYAKLEEWAEAVRALENVVKFNPDYTAAYQMLGSAHLSLGNREDARRVWAEGVEVAKRTRAWKAQQHLEGLLANTTAEAPPSQLCGKDDT